MVGTRAKKVHMTKQDWMAKNGFDLEDEMTYAVCGSNTYDIKDWLKEHGFLYSPMLNWHTDNVSVLKDLPAGFKCVGIKFDDYLFWNEEYESAFFKENAKVKLHRFMNDEDPTLSRFIGEVGDRLRNITVKVHRIGGYNGKFGWSNIYTFVRSNDKITWFTSKNLEVEVGDVCNFTGTIIKHEMYHDEEITCVNRCIVDVIEAATVNFE